VWHGCPGGPPPLGFPPRSAPNYPSRAVEAPKQQFNDPQLPPNYYCPEVKNNPDYDFSAGQMLVDLPDGKSLVVAAQKSGVVWAFDPDREGALVWKSDISRGAVTFGAAADSDFGYFALRGGALAAVRLKDGVDGTLRAYSTFDGRPIWQYDTTQKVDTVNGIPGKGGSIGSAGAVIVNGMVYVTSGYIGFQSGLPGNLLFAFGPPDR
jgi:polyvinyl alcohol dehydrogenase (cytochrome)